MKSETSSREDAPKAVAAIFVIAMIALPFFTDWAFSTYIKIGVAGLVAAAIATALIQQSMKSRDS